MKKRIYLDLFWTMLRIGLFTFGGGYAMLGLLENEFVRKRKWTDHEEFLDMVALSESTPGPIAINAATYLGYKTAGFWGALLATVGVVIPSFVIIYAISLFFDAFLSLRLVAAAFRGIQVAVIWLILSAGLGMLRSIKRTPLSIVLLLLSALTLLLTTLFAVHVSTIVILLLGGTVGLAAHFTTRLIGSKKEKKEQEETL